MHRLSLKITLLSSAGLGLGLALLYPLSDLSLPLAVIALLVAAGTTYAASVILLRRRMAAARDMLRLIRNHRFDQLRAVRQRAGDEMDELEWQVYRTGLSVEKEIREMEKMENYRREFIGNVSHELKTPIFAVQGFSETLLDGAIDDERVRRSFVEKILRNSARLGNLARDLSEISRIETGEVRLTPAPFSLDRLIHEVVESLEVHARDRRIALTWDVEKHLPHAYADREAIRQVLSNLVDNAIKYSNVDGHVEVVAKRVESEYVEVAVVDDGIGVAPQDLPRLTERFYRVDKSRSRGLGGTGLGLAIVKHLLAAHDQRLTVESTLGHGSTFSFELPIARTARSSNVV